ncbi:hypothetical protein L1887_01649 [Cichorium endivia]|nr:hypothetical protein L1887_01649 [Cichorium endivia]
MKCIFLRQRDQGWEPRPFTTRKPVYKKQKHHRNEHEEDLQVVHEPLNLRLIADVPSEAQEEENYTKEEEEVDRNG